MNLFIVLPATADATAIALLPALARLAAYAPPTVDEHGLLHAVLEVLGAADAPPAPLLALGAGMPMPAAGACVMAASPIHLAIHGDDVRVAGRATGLAADYAARAVTLLNGTFATDGIRFVAARSDAWFAQMQQAPDVTTAPVDAVIGQSLYACRPQGRDARLWERYGNEIQMLLFGLNDSTGLTGQVRDETRSASDAAPPNAVWFWGGGALSGGGAWREFRAFAAAADTHDAADLARGAMLASGRETEPLPENLAALPPVAVDQRILVVLPDVGDATLAAQWLAPALTALETGGLSGLTVFAGATATRIWSARPPSWLARLRARLATTRAIRLAAQGSAPAPRPPAP
jgi:hypothetical protein